MYYAEPGFSPPPFLETLALRDELMDYERCWRDGCQEAGTGHVGLCDTHFEQLREEEP